MRDLLPVTHPHGFEQRDAIAKSAERAGVLLADIAFEKFASVVEALGWVTWVRPHDPTSRIDCETQECAVNTLLNRATDAERTLWLAIEVSGQCASVDDVRMWLDVEAPRLVEAWRMAA